MGAGDSNPRHIPSHATAYLTETETETETENQRHTLHTNKLRNLGIFFPKKFQQKIKTEISFWFPRYTARGHFLGVLGFQENDTNAPGNTRLKPVKYTDRVAWFGNFVKFKP